MSGDEPSSAAPRSGLHALHAFMSASARSEDIQDLCGLAARTLAALAGASALVYLRHSNPVDGLLWSAAHGAGEGSRPRLFAAGPSPAPLDATPARVLEDLLEAPTQAAGAPLSRVHASADPSELGSAPGPALPLVQVLSVGSSQPSEPVGAWVGVSSPWPPGAEALAGLMIRHLVTVAALRYAESLRENTELKYQTMIEQLPAITYYRDLDSPGNASFISPQIEEILGYPPECYRENREFFVEHLHPDDRERVIRVQSDAAAAASMAVQGVEYRMIHRDGRTVWLANRALAVRDATGKPKFLIGVIFDITHTKQLEQRYLHSQKMEAVGRLAGGIAHDFNNILAVILGYGEFLSEALDEGADSYADLCAMLDAAERAKLLVRQLLAFSRQRSQTRVVIRLLELLDGMRAMVSRVLSANIEFEFDPDPDLGSTLADHSQLEQIIMNLFVNARDAMPDGGLLRVTASNVALDELFTMACEPVPPGQYLMFCVSDSGIGMDEHTMQRLFEPFFTTKVQGTGLGMSTVLGLVRQHGGTMWVSSELGQGTSVRVYLPRSRDRQPDEEDEAAPPRAAATLEPGAAPALGGDERILVIEDDEQLRVLTAAALTRLGYAVTVARHGGAAQWLFEEGATFDLVLSDMIMPGLSGPEFAEYLRAHAPELPLVFMTGYAGDTLEHPPLRAQHVLTKPFTLVDLATRLRQVLDEAGPPGRPVS